MASTSSKIRRGTIIIAVSVVLSRVLGILREVLIAGLVGIDVQKNAYDLAFLLPDIINHLISTGYLSITFIPIFTGFLVKDESERAWKFFSNILNVLGLALIVLSIFAWIFAKEFILLLASSNPDADTLQLAVRFSRIVIPAQAFFFYGAIFTAIQHIQQRFFLPSLIGLIYNLSIILGGVIGARHGLEGFAWGVLAGAFVGSFALQIFGAVKAKAKFYFVFKPRDKDLLRFLKITIPLVLGLGAVFTMEFVYRSFGSQFGQEGIALLSYSYRIMFTLVAVFGFAIGVASYPTLAKMAKNEEYVEINFILYDTLIKILALLAPTFLVFWFGAEQIVHLLFKRGAFDADAVVEVAGLLKWYMWGVFAMSSQILVVRCFYAFEKTWLPAIVNTLLFAVFLPFYPYFGQKYGIQAVPILSVISSSLQVFVLLGYWIRFSGWAHFPGFIWNTLKIALCFGIGFIALALIMRPMDDFLAYPHFILFVYLSVFSVAVFGLQFILQLLFKVSCTREMILVVLKRAGIIHH